MKETVIYQDLGTIGYQKAWDFQTELHQAVIARKRSMRDKTREDADWEAREHHLLFCNHNPVYTLGKSGSLDHLLMSEAEMESKGVEFFKINRGGDITFHGIGQVVGYPIFDLDGFFTDVHKYVRFLEEAIIRTMAHYGLEGIRIDEFTGVWLAGTNVLPQRKICAIGVHLSRWVTMHGFAFNINTDLSYFNNIVPCGINDPNKAVTSLAVELGREIDENEVKNLLKQHFQELFGFEFAK